MGLLGSAASIITVLMLAGFLTFYFLLDGDSAVRVATQGLPSGRRDRALDASRVAMWSAGGYLRRTALRATLRGVSMLVFLLVLGVPQAGPLAVVVFFGGLVPYLGSIFTSIIVLLAALASGGIGTALVLAILIVAEVVFDGRIPALKVDPKGVRLHPALVIVALPTGAALGGIPGMIIAVPTVAVAVALTGTVIEVLSGLPRGAPRVTVEGDVPIWLDRAAQWSWRLLVGAGLAAIAIGLASLVPSIIAPVLVAVTLAATFLPATRALEARGWSRTRAAGTHQRRAVGRRRRGHRPIHRGAGGTDRPGPVRGGGRKRQARRGASPRAYRGRRATRSPASPPRSARSPARSSGRRSGRRSS